MTYPATPGYAKGSDTSRNAAETLYGRDSTHFAVLTALYCNTQGLNVDDTKRMVQAAMKRDFDRSTVAARFTELEDKGFIQATEGASPSARGKPATIYKITIKGRDFILNS